MRARVGTGEIVIDVRVTAVVYDGPPEPLVTCEQYGPFGHGNSFTIRWEGSHDEIEPDPELGDRLQFVIWPEGGCLNPAPRP